MRTMRTICLLICGGLMVSGCQAQQSNALSQNTPARATALADAYVKEYFDTFPYQALENGAPDVHPDRLGDHSLGALKRWAGREDMMLKELREVPLAALKDTPQALTSKFLQNQLEAAQAFRACRMELWNVSPTYTGWQAEFAVVAGLQATATDTERRHALARFSELPRYLDTEIANLREGLRFGYSAPRHNVELVIGQMDAMLAAPLVESPFVQMAKPGTSPGFRQDLERLERERIRPVIARYREFLKNEYLPAAREAVGVSANPGGAGCYSAAIKYHSTADMTPQQVQDLGKRQIERIHAEMQEIGKRSFGTDDPTKLLAMLRSDSKYRFKSRDELIQYAEAAIERAHQAVAQSFGRLPKAPIIVEPYPPFLEKSAPIGQSVAPTADGKPGKYLINAYKATEQSRGGLEATAFHETYPGHHLQASIALERHDLHPISRYFFISGFGEGWALYSERLADEMKLYSSDVDRLGMLSNEAFRAARLVVDSGIHAFGWTREQAIAYLLDNTAESPSHAAAEIDRYIAYPGQATSYMIGNLEIRRLRDQAEQALGPAFNIKQFHDMVLQDGTVPLWVLREKTEQWISQKRPGK